MKNLLGLAQMEINKNNPAAKNNEKPQETAKPAEKAQKKKEPSEKPKPEPKAKTPEKEPEKAPAPKPKTQKEEKPKNKTNTEERLFRYNPIFDVSDARVVKVVRVKRNYLKSSEIAATNLSVYLLEDEKRLLEKLSEEHSMTPSTYIRTLIVNSK